MRLIPVVATDLNGREVAATQLGCPNCDGVTFVIYVVAGGHHHLECADCGGSFCNGDCADDEIGETEGSA